MNDGSPKKRRLQAMGLLVILAIAVAAAAASGCQRLDKAGKNWESGMEGLQRTITVYDHQGDVIARWNAKTHIEAKRNGVIAFLDSAGHETKVAGGIVIVQEN